MRLLRGQKMATRFCRSCRVWYFCAIFVQPFLAYKKYNFSQRNHLPKNMYIFRRPRVLRLLGKVYDYLGNLLIWAFTIPFKDQMISLLPVL